MSSAPSCPDSSHPYRCSSPLFPDDAQNRAIRRGKPPNRRLVVLAALRAQPPPACPQTVWGQIAVCRRPAGRGQRVFLPSAGVTRAFIGRRCAPQTPEDGVFSQMSLAVPPPVAPGAERANGGPEGLAAAGGLRTVCCGRASRTTKTILESLQYTAGCAARTCRSAARQNRFFRQWRPFLCFASAQPAAWHPVWHIPGIRGTAPPGQPERNPGTRRANWFLTTGKSVAPAPPEPP
jgi:hypothetical protein